MLLSFIVGTALKMPKIDHKYPFRSWRSCWYMMRYESRGSIVSWPKQIELLKNSTPSHFYGV